METPEQTARRQRMIEHDIRARGVRDPLVLEAVARVPRERFVAEQLERSAYDDHPLPIGEGQTISQPYIVALMAEAAELDATSRVLEIGAGSGYAAAVVSEIAAAVFTIECLPALADMARDRLAELGYDRVTVIKGDGTLGLAAEAPFDAIIVTAGGPSVPEALLEQLADGGRLVIPVGPRSEQQLIRVRRDGDTFSEEQLGGVRFVALVGEQGWPDAR